MKKTTKKTTKKKQKTTDAQVYPVGLAFVALPEVEKVVHPHTWALDQALEILNCDMDVSVEAIEMWEADNCGFDCDKLKEYLKTQSYWVDRIERCKNEKRLVALNKLTTEEKILLGLDLE